MVTDTTAKGWGNIAKVGSLFPRRMVAAAGALGSMARGRLSSVARKTTKLVMVAGQVGGAEVRRILSTTTQARHAASAKAVSAFQQVTQLGQAGLHRVQERGGEWERALGAEGQGAASAVMGIARKEGSQLMGAARREGSQLMSYFSRIPAHMEMLSLPAVGLKMDRLVHSHVKGEHAGQQSIGATSASRHSATCVPA